jgi:flagellar hook-basal body complex protein FliE
MINGIMPAGLSPSVGTPPITGAVGPSAAAGAGLAGQTSAAAPTDFAAVLGQMAMDAIGTVKASEATAVAGVKGSATVQQVVEAVMAAEQTLQAGVAIRDKVVSAYMEVSRMSI